MLKGKVALVTGSTSGIGLAIAKALIAEGAEVVLNGLGDASEIKALCAELSARHIAADLQNPEECVALAQRAEAEMGRVDILVNNAGIQYVAPIEEFPPEKWDAVLAINLSSAFHTIRTLLPGMRSRGFGRIVNIASAHGLVASPQKSAYVAAKHGLVGLTKVVALEAAESPVTCNAVCPGWVRTPLVERQIEARAAAENISIDEAAKRLLGERQPTKRFVSVEEIAAAVIYLCSEGARNVTGSALTVDGGFTTH